MSATIDRPGKELYEFGPFRVDVEREILLRSGEAVSLTPKTFQVLVILLRHGSAGVSKDELMKEVWPDTFVEEANLSRTIFMLRKALGETPKDHLYIVTVPGHGYRLAADVVAIPEQELDLTVSEPFRIPGADRARQILGLDVSDRIACSFSWLWHIPSDAAITARADREGYGGAGRLCEFHWRSRV